MGDLIVTHSGLECFAACKRKYQLRYIDGLVPVEKNAALEFGTAIHECLAVYLGNIMKHQQTETECDSWETLQAIHEKANELDLSPIDRAKLDGLMCGYLQKWHDTDASKFDVIDIEHEFSNWDICDGVKFVGKADGILRCKADGSYFILEHKTASIVDDDYVAQKEIDAQTLAYAVCISEEIGHPIKGAIHDLITKQKIRQKKGESEEDFCARLRDDVTGDNFRRVVVEFTDEKLSAFRQELADKCSDLLHCKSYYKCTGNCLGRFGACEYLPLCGGKGISIDELFTHKRAHEEITAETLGIE